MTLFQGEIDTSYEVLSIEADDEELERFLFTLGCYPGETLSLVSRTGKSFVLAIRDGRYNIDENLAKVLKVKEVSQ